VYTTASVLGCGEQEGIWWDVLLMYDPVLFDEVYSMIVLYVGCLYVLRVFKFLLIVIL
jgi:hypothetical protein